MAQTLISDVDCLLDLEGGLALRRASIRIANGRIAAIETNATPPRPDDIVIEGRGLLAVPGLVNAHFHSPDTLIRSSAPMLPLELWSLHSAAGRERRSPREAYVAAMLGAIEMLAGGTSTVLDHIRVSPDIDPDVLGTAASAYRDIGMRAVIAPILADRPVAETLPLSPADIGDDDISAWGRRQPLPAAEQIAVAERFLARWHGAEGRIHGAVGPSAPQRCTDAMLEAARDLAEARNLPVHMHLLETRAQQVIGRDHPAGGTLARLHALGLMRPRTSFAHAIWLDDADLDRLAESGAAVVHNPVSNARLGSGVCPLHGLLSRGVRVGLGTDSCCCNDSANLLETVKWAAILGNLGTDDADRWVGPATALRLATAGGADVLGLGAITGKLAPGLAADITLLHLDAPAFVPPLDPVRQLVLGGAGATIARVLVAGQTVFADGRCTLVDQTALWAEARDLAAARLSDAAPDYAAAAAMAGPITRMRQRLAREDAA
jgi:5-methylthioadenosine/S-adenosylhomocysteine deaminase